MSSSGRNTTRRDKHRKAIAQGRPPCHLCGDEIDYEAHHLDPLSFQIDHIVPLIQGGADELENLSAAHRKCNRDKGDGRREVKAPVAFVTQRQW